MISAALLLLSQSLFFSLHLSVNPGSFPQPLSAQEEADCLARWAEGDLTEGKGQYHVKCSDDAGCCQTADVEFLIHF